MDKIEQVAEQIKAEGPQAVKFVKGYLDAELGNQKDRRHVESEDYIRGYLAGFLDRETLTD